MISIGKRAEKSATASKVVGVLERRDESRDDLPDHRLERGDGAWREHPADQRPQPVVFGRVHHDDAAVRLDELRVLRQRREVDSVRARHALPVAVRRHHVGEARERVEPVVLVEVHRCFVAQAPVHLRGVVEVLVGERVEFNGRRPSCALLDARCRTVYSGAATGRGASVTDGTDSDAPPLSTASTTVTRCSTSMSEPVR